MRVPAWLLLLSLLGGTLGLPTGLGAQGDPYTALALTRLDPPTAAKTFTAKTPQGGTVSLAEHRGKVVFLNFWATWCPPCRVEMPGMQRLYARLRQRGLVILAISLDADDGLVAPFLEEHSLTFPVALDPQMQVAGAYRVLALPSTFLVDRQGRVVARAFGPREWDSPEGIAVVEDLLGRPQS